MKWNSYSLRHFINETLEKADWDAEYNDTLRDLAAAIIKEFDLGDIKFSINGTKLYLNNVPNPFLGRKVDGFFELSDKAQYQTCFYQYYMWWSNGYDYSTRSSVNIRNVGEEPRLILSFYTLKQWQKLEQMEK